MLDHAISVGRSLFRPNGASGSGRAASVEKQSLPNLDHYDNFFEPNIHARSGKQGGATHSVKRHDSNIVDPDQSERGKTPIN